MQKWFLLGVAIAVGLMTVPVMVWCGVQGVAAVGSSGFSSFSSPQTPFSLSVILIVASTVTACWWIGQSLAASIASRLHRQHRPHELFTPYYDQR